MGLFDFVKKAPTKDASVETGGLRDAYMKYLEQAAVAGVQPMTYEQFVRALDLLKKQNPSQVPQVTPQ